MLKINDSNTFQRTITGLSLIAAPLVGLIGALLTPQFTGEIEQELVVISEHTERWLVGGFFTLITFFLFIIAVLGILRLLRHRSVILGHVGAGLVMLGAFFHGAIIGYSLVEVPLVKSAGTLDSWTTFAHQMYESSAFTMILLPFLSFYIGWTLLAVALWRARVVPLWIAAAIVVAVLSEFVGPESLSPELMLALFLIAGSYIGRMVLRSSSKELEHGPTEASVPLRAAGGGNSQEGAHGLSPISRGIEG